MTTYHETPNDRDPEGHVDMQAGYRPHAAGHAGDL